jgi:hypothetical protein
MVDRMADHWEESSGLATEGPVASDAADLTPAAWTNRTLGGVAGFALSFLALLPLAAHLPMAYRPYDGIVGTPAFLDRAPQFELWCYALGLALFGGLGWYGGQWAGRNRRRGAYAIAITATAGAGVLAAHHVGWIPSSDATRLLRAILGRPLAVVELAALGLGAWWLCPAPRPTNWRRRRRGGGLAACGRSRRRAGRHSKR